MIDWANAARTSGAVAEIVVAHRRLVWRSRAAARRSLRRRRAGRVVRRGKMVWTRAGAVVRPARHDVDVHVRDGLPGGVAVVDADRGAGGAERLRARDRRAVATMRKSASAAAGSRSSMDATCARGTTSTWPSASGCTSRNATPSSVASATTSAGISPATMRQKMQLIPGPPRGLGYPGGPPRSTLYRTPAARRRRPCGSAASSGSPVRAMCASSADASRSTSAR